MYVYLLFLVMFKEGTPFMKKVSIECAKTKKKTEVL